MIGAGILLLAASTGRVLLIKRSGEVRNPHTWSVPGGLVEPGESVDSAARRETAEEVGFDGPYIETLYLYTYFKGRFEFTTFLGIIEDEFTPELNWESEDWCWCRPSFTDLPMPLHRGAFELFQHRTDVLQMIASQGVKGERWLRRS